MRQRFFFITAIICFSAAIILLFYRDFASAGFFAMAWLTMKEATE